MKKKIFAAFLAATMMLASAFTTFAADGYETVKEFTFDDATGLKGFTAGWTSDDRYNLVPADVKVAGGAFKPAGEYGALMEGTFDGSKGFRITATISMPADVNAAGNPWFKSIVTVVNIAAVVGEEKVEAFNSYSLNSSGNAQGYQAHAHTNTIGGEAGHTWGGDAPNVEFNKEHVVTMLVVPNADGNTCTVAMTVDGKFYPIPNGNAGSFPNYLSQNMSVIIGSTMYGDDYMYDILDVKVEKVVGEVEIPTEEITSGEVETTEAPTTEAPTETPTTEAPTTEAPTTTQNNANNNGGSNVLPIIIAVVVVAAVAVIVVTLKSKKKDVK